MDWKEMWNNRYAGEGFVYGTEPNNFFRQVIDSLEPGKLLLPGEGEGRNAIYAAKKGWKVKAIDFSETGMEKALGRASNEKVEIDYQVLSLGDYTCIEGQFDLIALIYIHLLPESRQKVHRHFLTCLKEGGLLIMEAFHKNQLKYNTGGPRTPVMLYSREELADDFANLEIIQLEDLVEDIIEGRFHTGKSHIIRLIARKTVKMK